MVLSEYGGGLGGVGGGGGGAGEGGKAVWGRGVGERFGIEGLDF